MGERFVAVERRRRHHNAASPLQWSRDRLAEWRRRRWCITQNTLVTEKRGTQRRTARAYSLRDNSNSTARSSSFGSVPFSHHPT